MPVSTFGPEIGQVLEELRDPAAYPHPVDKVKAVQTHISCVFLTGCYAYKIKKPVTFDFLDYSSLDRRRYFCEQELVLNCRLCPDVYIDVVPITLRQGRLQVGGAGEPVEWAVRMHQLRASDMLATRLQDGRVGVSDIERLAGTLAEFHARAAADDPVRAFGSLSIVSATIAGTLHVMDQVAIDFLPEEVRRTIRSSLEQFQRSEAALFQERQAEDRTRDCHGDLRIQNICLDARFDAGLQIFDCIEFNQEFRFIDVAADLAYLAMDLDLAGRADLRGRLVNHYIKVSGDHGLARILPYYQIYRACVRGNIALLAAAESEIADAERAAHREIAAAAYDLARGYAARRPGPALLIMAGFSGSGKSELARQVCRRLPAVLLSSDKVRKELEGLPAIGRLDAEHYRAKQRAAVYRELRQRAGEMLQHGETVLLDATFLSDQEREAAAVLAAHHRAEFWLLECQCSDTEIRRRLKERRHDAYGSDAGLAVYQDQLRSSVPIALPSHPHAGIAAHLVVDTDLPVLEAAGHVVDAFLCAGK